jgi:fused signal recognition particle receptor
MVMFKFLREKIKNWAEKISKHEEEKAEKEIDIEKLSKKADKIKKEVHLEPSLDKQLRGKTIGDSLRSLEEDEPKKEGFFERIKSKIQKVKISEKEFEIYSEELEMLLLENNVALEVSEKIIKELKEKVVGEEFLKKEIEGQIKENLRDIIEEILIEPFSIVDRIRGKTADQAKDPYVILFCGINGTGKTTTIAKIADHLKKNGISCALAASDTFRTAAIEQIKKHGEKLGIKVIAHEYGSDPAAVAFDAIKYAKRNFINCVLIDTAGRMHTAKNLIREIEKIAKVCKPDLKIFVGESITGNDIIEQVKSFDWALNIDGIVLTKADIDEKGGTALSVSYILKKPILYLGTGQEYNKIEVFDKHKFIEKLGL